MVNLLLLFLYLRRSSSCKPDQSPNHQNHYAHHQYLFSNHLSTTKLLASDVLGARWTFFVFCNSFWYGSAILYRGREIERDYIPLWSFIYSAVIFVFKQNLKSRVKHHISLWIIHRWLMYLLLLTQNLCIQTVCRSPNQPLLALFVQFPEYVHGRSESKWSSGSFRMFHVQK